MPDSSKSGVFCLECASAAGLAPEPVLSCGAARNAEPLSGPLLGIPKMISER